MVPFSKYIFGNYSFSYKKNSMNFEVFLILKTTHGFTMSPIVNLLKTPPSTFEQFKSSVSTSPNKFWILFQLFYLSNHFCQLFWVWVIFKASTLLHLSFDLKPTLLDSPLYPQPRTILIHSSSFQIFQNSVSASLDQICQIWWNSYLHYSKNLDQCAADRRHTTAERRSAPPIAPWLSAWPHAR